MSFTARHGQLQDVSVTGLPWADDVDAVSQEKAVDTALDGRSLHDIGDWRDALSEAAPVPLANQSVGRWLNHLFGLDKSS